MNFRTTMLTLIGWLVSSSATSQQYSSRSIDSSGLQVKDSSFKTDSTSSFLIKHNDSFPLKNKSIKFSNEKKINDKAEKKISRYSEKYADDFTRLLKIDSDKYLKKPIALNSAQILYTAISDSSFSGNGYPYYQGAFELSSSWSFFGIPITLNFQNQGWVNSENNFQDNVSFRFDKENYLQQLKKQLSGKFDPASLINDMPDPFTHFKEQAIQKLNNDLLSINSSYNDMLDKDVIAVIHDTATLFSGDLKSFRERLLSAELVKQSAQAEMQLSSLQQKSNRGETIDDNEMNRVTAINQRMNALQKFIQKIEEHKTSWESSGMLSKVKNFEVAKKFRVTQLVNDPSFIRKQAKQHLSLKGMQRFFLNVNRLNMGQDALTLSPMSFQHFLHTGISTEFLSAKGKTYMLMAGRQKDFNSVLDYGFRDNLFSNNGQMKAARIGLGSTSISTSHLSVSSFNQTMGNGFAMPSLAANDMRKILVTTISNRLSVGEKGIIEIDLSRSASGYRQTSNTADSILRPNSNFSKIISSDNLMSNTALALKYGDENIKKGLSYQFNFGKVANGYTNPGNSFLNGGSTEFGGQVRKSFYKNKLQFFFRGNVRDYKYEEYKNARWQNLYMVADIKWRMKKGQHVGFRYQPNRMLRIEEGVRNNVTAIDRLSIESNLYKKIGKTGYRNYMTVAYQKNVYALSPSASSGNTSLLFTSFQNIGIGKDLLFANISYTHSDNNSQYLFFNSSLSLDGGYSFLLFKRIIASSAIVYASVNDWYQQVGVRQSLSGQLNKKFYMSVYLDARKNIKLLQQLWDSPVRADISIKYILKP